MTINDLVPAIAESMLANGIPQATVNKVIREVQAAAEEEKAAREPKAPKAKTQVVFLGLKPGDEAPEAGWAFQIEADAAPAVVVDRIREAALSFNRSPKGRRNPVRSIAETLEVCTPKHWKDEAHPERRTKVLTREPVQILTTDGRLA